MLQQEHRNGEARFLRDCLYQVCVKTGITVEREQSCQAGSRDADLLLLNWDKGRHTAWDLTVVCPTAPSHWPLKMEKVTRCLRDAEATKEGSGGVRCANRGWGFVASAFSTWGMAGPGARFILGEVIKRATNGLTGHSAAEKASSIRRMVSITLARGVAAQLRGRDRVLDGLE